MRPAGANSGGCLCAAPSLALAIQDPRSFTQGQSLLSPIKELQGSSFRFRLLVFPAGTEATQRPEQLAAFVEVVGFHHGNAFSSPALQAELAPFLRRAFPPSSCLCFCSYERVTSARPRKMMSASQLELVTLH